MITPSEQSNANYIGLEVCDTRMRAAALASDGRILERLEAPLESQSIVGQGARTITSLRDSVGDIAAAGIAVPGLINPKTSRVVVSSDLPEAARSDIRAELEKAAGLPVLLQNDANAAAYGEYLLGSGRGSRNMFYVTIGSGIGGAIIIDGKLWFGDSGFAGEFGHITVLPEGDECACGNIGCLETVASAPNIVRRTHERLNRDGTSSLSRLAVNKNFTAPDIAREAKNGDEFALMMIERTGKYIGTAIAAVINLLNIERIVLGGGVMEAGELILKPIIREAGRRSFQPCFEATRISIASLGSDAVAAGVALLARDRVQF